VSDHPDMVHRFPVLTGTYSIPAEHTPRARFSPLTRDQLIETVDRNTVALETFGRELARLQREKRELEAALAQGQANCDAVYEDLRAERDAAVAALEAAQESAVEIGDGYVELRAQRDAARAEAARLRLLLACGARACPIVLVIHKS